MGTVTTPTATASLTTAEGQFLTSYDDFTRYPHNLSCKNYSKAILDAYASKLDHRSGTWLGFGPEREAFLPVCELNPGGNGWTKTNVLNESELQNLLGEVRLPSGALTSTTATKWKFNKRDSKCRFVFIGPNAHSRESLKVTPNIVQRLFSYHQVMPGFLDFLDIFGKYERPRHSYFSSFREQTSALTAPSAPMDIRQLGRSGSQYQICFNLKRVALYERPGSYKKEWTVRQAAAHHQFDVKYGNSLWIFAHGHWDLRDHINAMTHQWNPGQNGLKFDTLADCLQSTFTIYQMLIEWSSRGWNDYLACTEDEVENLSKQAAVTGISKRWNIDDMIKIQRFEEDAKKAAMHLESNIDILKALERFYTDLDSNTSLLLRQYCHDDVLCFTRQLREVTNDLVLHTKRAKMLIHTTSDRKALIMQHLQAQATTKAEQLNQSIFNFSYMAQKETIAMRVMAAVTILYLPATFVSSFFSTDIVKYQSQPQVNNGTGAFNKDFAGTFSNTAIWRWIAVTLPLTTVTIAFGIWYYNREKNHRDAQIAELEKVEIG